MIDFDALLFGPAYRVFAEPAVLKIGAATYQLDVIDGTRGIPVEEGGPIAVETVRPVVDVRRSQLAQRGIAVSRLIDAELVSLDKAGASSPLWTSIETRSGSS
jgi:hypothetical protein